MGRLRLIVAEVKVTHVKLVPGINEEEKRILERDGGDGLVTP